VGLRLRLARPAHRPRRIGDRARPHHGVAESRHTPRDAARDPRRFDRESGISFGTLYRSRSAGVGYSTSPTGRTWILSKCRGLEDAAKARIRARQAAKAYEMPAECRCAVEAYAGSIEAMRAALDRREAVPDSIPSRMAATARPIKPVPFGRVSHLAGVPGGVLAIAVFCPQGRR
jgi:hypothetical protein